MLPGFTCYPESYTSLVDSLASWGYAVIQVNTKQGKVYQRRGVFCHNISCSPTFGTLQYHRPLNDMSQPSSETESLYWEQVMAWRSAYNGTWRQAPAPLAGQFAAGPVAVMGHSMGGGEQVATRLRNQQLY
jgi:hypothetical protein